MCWIQTSPGGFKKQPQPFQARPDGIRDGDSHHSVARYRLPNVSNSGLSPAVWNESDKQNPFPLLRGFGWSGIAASFHSTNEPVTRIHSSGPARRVVCFLL